MKKLISKAGFVFLHPAFENISKISFSNKQKTYFEFLEKNIEISMFIPTDEHDEPIDHPSRLECYSGSIYRNLEEQYRLVSEMVIFKGFSYIWHQGNWCITNGTKIYDLKILKEKKVKDMMPENLDLVDNFLQVIKEYY